MSDKIPPAKQAAVISVSKEIIWHMTCGACGYYWTVPTMDEQDNPVRRKWTCPLCATNSPAEIVDLDTS